MFSFNPSVNTGGLHRLGVWPMNLHF